MSHFSSGDKATATIIAHGVRVEGNFSSQSDVLIEGEVEGNVSTTGMLTVGSQARLKADVTAENASIAGAVEGNLHIGSHLDIKATAMLLGDVTCETATLESGATINGKVIIGSAKAPVTRDQEIKITKGQINDN
ncbi:MAG: polymer-forming cytoskeletal protein [Patescibacteria group bacterium]|nr:polymer-forming cytoskeletal protein [Patescibacteria group bacterium]MBU2508907.1 polymer-forming cytoskeletal protein [Patescibacteria group bacterium]